MAPGTIAHTALVEGPNAVVLVVTNAVAVRIGGTISAASADRVIVQARVLATRRTTDAQSKRQVEQEEILVVPLPEKLDLHVAGELAIEVVN